jgi:hypothetical protein
MYFLLYLPKWAILTYTTPVYITVVTVRESYNVGTMFKLEVEKDGEFA